MIFLSPARIGYEYPPSQFIQSFGPIDPKSHYYCEGKAHFGNVEEVKCHFEVAYTLACKIVVVCYFDRLTRLPSRTCTYISGKKVGRKWNQDFYEVTINGCTLVDVLELYDESFNIAPGYRENLEYIISVAFSAEEYRVNEGGSKAFPYLAEGSADNIGYAITGLQLPQHLSGNYPKYHGGKDSLFQSLDESKEDLRNRLETLGLRFPDHEAIYSNLYSAYCIDSIPVSSSWSQDMLMDVWCAFVSLAIGRDVQWIYQERFAFFISHEINTAAISRVWKQRHQVFGQQSFHAFVAPINVTLSRRQIERNIEQVAIFLDTIMHRFLSLPFSAGSVADYIRIIRYFVEYMLLTERREDQARLIATTTEELLKKWLGYTATIGETKLKKMLEQFFDSPSHTVCDEFRKIGKDKIKRFVHIRNFIAHEGRFESTTVTQREEEFCSLLNMLVHMIFTIFGYDKDYIEAKYESP